MSGTNDLLRRRFDAEALRSEFEAIQSALIDEGATVLTFTLPDLGDVMPLARLLRRRLLMMNQALRDAAAGSGAILCDFAVHAVASDPRLWSDDRLHANSAGHARIAEALAYHLSLPGSNHSWSEPLEGDRPHGLAYMLQSEVRWILRHLMPWSWRHLRGRSSGDGVRAKLPSLTRIEKSPL